MRNSKRRKLKPGYTIKTCLTELEAIKDNYKKAQKGFRSQFRNTMEMTQRMIVRLQTNGKLEARFKRAVLDERKKNGERHSNTKFNLSLEVVAKATGAFSREGRKVAWKRARALDYLREIGVEVSDTARAIKDKGGLEKIVAEAIRAKSIDRRGPVSSASPKPAINGSIDSRVNDREVSVPVWMKLSDRDEIAEQSIGSRFILTALRVGQAGGDLKIAGVKMASGDTEDWSVD
jgi:hypothetical protein